MSKARKRKTLLIALAFMLPFFVLYTVFTIWPVIQGFYVSLHKWGLMGKQSFLGFDNYVKFTGDKNFWAALWHTTFFTLITTPMLVIVSMALAMLANRPTKLKKGLRIIFYLPSVLSVSVAAFIAKFAFTPYTGLINGLLHQIGVLPASQELQWLQSPSLVWVTVSVMTVWWTIGFPMLLYLSALQDISPDVYEAASIDGASRFQQLIHLELPLLKPTTWLVGLLQMIACFKVFGQIQLITGGGPAGSTRPLIQYIYETAFKKNNLGYAAAMSYVLFGILLILSIGQQILQRRSED
ncbi:carbohydrate ABC transporter permease [Marvinbryantia formatexigens]|nr:sugar ABC transporter permease [Marvinbryantia formatexigens]UWO23321.1 sugar ABC transporter permease [Marvinbryantia formatexigens DSM 14469]SDG41627.1 multiple sugar transport system permease protein [Marvinbryantia formatexigens]